MSLGFLDDTSVAELASLPEASAAARVLRGLDTKRHRAVLDMLDPEHAKKVASFAAVDESKVGNVVRSAAMSVEEGTPVSRALELVREHQEKVMDYLYVVDQDLKLVGVLPIKRLLLGDASQPVDSLATSNPDFLSLDDSLMQAATHPRWSTTKIMPVLDHMRSFAGVVARADLPATLESEVAMRDASRALAEAFEVGVMGLLRLLFRGGGRA